MPRHLRLSEPHDRHPTRGAAVLEALAQGAYLDTAAEYAGIGARTLDRYIAEGKAAAAKADTGEAVELTPREVEYLDFWRSYKRARAAAEVEALEVIWAAARSGTWQAAAWILERRYPDRWGRGPRPVEQEPREVTEAEAAAARRYLAQLPDSPLADLLEESDDD